MTTPIPGPSPLTHVQVLESLTGYDEIEIEKQFGADPVALSKKNRIQFIRALVFIVQRRAGLAPLDAKKHAMNIPMGVLNDQFAADPDDLEGDDLEGDDEGKDG